MFAVRFINSINSYRRRRQTATELASLTDQQLRDIGLNRYDLFAPMRSR